MAVGISIVKLDTIGDYWDSRAGIDRIYCSIGGLFFGSLRRLGTKFINAIRYFLSIILASKYTESTACSWTYCTRDKE